MRWAQLAFVEDDPGHYKPEFWLDYYKRIHADAVCLSAGGCVAFYPTKIPLHYRSKFLGNSDTFGDMVTGCRKLGMNVIARVDPHAAHQDVQDAHPDWIAVQANGQPYRHWAMPTSWVTCALGPYNFEFMTSVIREIMTNYKVDGIFANRWNGSGMCYCQHCQKNFRDFSGLDLPRPAGGRRDRRGADPSTRPGIANACSNCIRFGKARSKKSTRCRVLPQWLRPDSGKRLGSDSLRGPAKPLPQPAALAEWKVREGRPLHLRHEADRGSVRCHGGFAVPVDGFRAESERGPGLRGGRHRAGLPPVGDQVQCQAARPALAQAGGGSLRLALEE